VAPAPPLVLVPLARPVPTFLMALAPAEEGGCAARGPPAALACGARLVVVGTPRAVERGPATDADATLRRGLEEAAVGVDRDATPVPLVVVGGATDDRWWALAAAGRATSARLRTNRLRLSTVVACQQLT